MAKSADRNGMSEDEAMILEEAIHFTRVLKSFRQYKRDALTQVAKSEKSFKELPPKHQEILPDHLEVLEKMKQCIEQNSAVCHLIVRNCGNAFQNKTYQELQKEGTSSDPRPMDLDKVRTTLKQIMRDWSPEGKTERSFCYEPIINEITSRMPPLSQEAKKSILVPGCGLGRLAWELARRGYRCEGNEFSFFMLFTSDFILNRTPFSSTENFHQFTIHPWVTQKCNVPSWQSIMAPIKFPDVNPADLPPNSEFSMAAGDFLECYEHSNSWNCVATCYFIDTAHNIISYIERIYHILTPGGLWVNLGPLLYHFADLPNEKSVEFSYEQVVEIVKKVGFQILKDERGVTSTYIDNSTSMLQYVYKCGLLVAIKPESSNNG